MVDYKIMGKSSGKILGQKKVSEKDLDAYFEEIYKEYFRRLYAYALTITKSKMLSQDIVSDVFYNLWTARDELFSIKELKSYLFTSVKNRSISAMSDNPVRFQSEKHDEIISSVEQVDPEELMIGNELRQFIDQTIEKLPPQCGLVFRMVKEQGLQYSEVAEELGISRDTVKYHVTTALKKLKSELEVHFSEAKIVKWIARVVATMLAFDGLKYFLIQ